MEPNQVSNVHIGAAHELMAPMMGSTEIAALVDKRHGNVLRDGKIMLIKMYGAEYLSRLALPRIGRAEYLRDHADELMGAIFADESKWSHLLGAAFSLTRDARGYIAEMHFDRNHSLNLVAGYDPLLRMRIIQRLEELEKVTVTRSLLAPEPVAVLPNKLAGELAVAECMARLTNVSESGKLAMIHAICSKNAVDTHFLPTHAVDGPPGSVSSLEAETATDLLKRRGEAKGVKGASAQSFNKRAKLAGYLRETSRPTSDLANHPDGRKRYLIVTSKGEAFGKNVVDIQSPRQTQPRWYSERFDAFCKLLWAETKDLTD
jgi:hypothetical protein